MVPAEVPSERQSSTPLVPLLALKYTWLPAEVSSSGYEWALPVRMSRTMPVPVLMPSVRQSSKPLTPSLAEK